MLVEAARPGNHGKHSFAEQVRQAKVLTITRDLAQVLATTAQGNFLPAQSQDFSQLLIHMAVFIEKMAPARAESAKLAAKHGFANKAVAIPLTIEALLGAIVDARDTQGGSVERQDVQQQSAPRPGRRRRNGLCSRLCAPGRDRRTG